MCHVAGYILSGGAARRMNGKQKLFLQYQDKFFGEWLIEAMSGVEKIYISEAKVPQTKIACAEYIIDVLKDKGPMGGVFSGLLKCQEEALFVVPCDMFGLQRELVIKMIECYEKGRKPVFLKCTEDIIPFPGIYTKGMLPLIRHRLYEKNYKMKSLFYQEVAEKYIFIEADRYLDKIQNINTEEAYRRLIQENRHVE
nr:molybdenum cofactor guanylyltransferase [uncultured Sellimonas sp.]